MNILERAYLTFRILGKVRTQADFSTNVIGCAANYYSNHKDRTSVPSATLLTLRQRACDCLPEASNRVEVTLIEDLTKRIDDELAKKVRPVINNPEYEDLQGIF
jgi:hypothetical protein